MTGLIPFAQRFIAGQSTTTVPARKLHEFLDVRRDFTTWIKHRIEKGRFIEGEDYIKVFTKSGENLKGGRPSAEYYLTLDMAKMLAMLENNDMGDRARRYFIDCERQLQETATPALPNYQRILMTLEHGRVTAMQPAAPDAMIGSPAEIARMMREQGWVTLDPRQLRHLTDTLQNVVDQCLEGMAVIREFEQEEKL